MASTPTLWEFYFYFLFLFLSSVSINWNCLFEYPLFSVLRSSYHFTFIMRLRRRYFSVLRICWAFFTVISFKLSSDRINCLQEKKIILRHSKLQKYQPSVEFIFSRWILIYCPFIPINTFYGCVHRWMEKCSPNKNRS